MNSRLVHVGGGVRESKDGPDWPYDIWITYLDESLPIALGEGFGMGSIGCSIPAEQLLDERWREHVEICKCGWLVDEIQRRMINGAEITAEKLEEHWRSRE